ncbi:MAG: transmembrane amino acid transporter protein-domain-containing protein, partial [Olpidium bornovanus]
WTIRILIKSSRLSGQTTTYQGLVEYCFGRAGMVAISVFQRAARASLASRAQGRNVRFDFAGMAAYTVIVGDTIPSVLLFTFPSIPTLPVIWLLVSRKFMIFATTVFISFPLSLYRDMSKLAKASALALVAILVIVITILVEGPNVAAELKGDPSYRLSIANSEVIQAIGVISFGEAFVCHHNTFLIYGSLQKPTLDRFAVVTHLSTGTSLLASSVLAVSGYWVFTKKAQGRILCVWGGVF